METRTSNIKTCSIEKASRVIGDFWNILIIRDLLNGCRRFNQLLENLESITNSTLSDRLKTLVDEGIVERKQYECVPPKVEYTLTERGRSLQGLIKEVENYSNKWVVN